MDNELNKAAAELMAAADRFTNALDKAQKGRSKAPMALAMALACDATETVTVVSSGDELELLKLAAFMQAHFSGEVDPADVSTVQ